MSTKSDIEKRKEALGPFDTDFLPRLVKGGEDKPKMAGYEDWDEASSLGFIVEFTRPDQRFTAIYLGVKENVGPNKSRLYNFIAGDGTKFSLWGSTILDAKMDDARPEPGMELLIYYQGDVPTQRGATPAKDFRVLVNRHPKK